jgi:glycosyltransferase involved in cell wall biosynthesis
MSAGLADSIIAREICFVELGGFRIREQRMAEEESSRRAAQGAAPGGLREPKSLLYSINARIGGHGLDLNAHESLLLADDRSFLGRAIGYDNRQQDISARYIMSLRWHPVRLLSFLSPPYYYDAKKKYVDWVASRQLKSRRYDLFHGWAGNSARSLRVARKCSIPSVLEIPTWHRDKGKVKPREKVETSKHEKNARFPETLFKRLLVTRQQSLEEYDLADLLLVPSQCSAKTFTAAGIPEEKLFLLGAGVDTELFRNDDSSDLPVRFSAERPMRAVFCGALIRRKGVHVLLEAWHKLALPHAQLTLAGTVHDEIQPYLSQFGGPSLNAVGFTSCVHEVFRQSDVHIFPSECEGSAKSVYEACAAGLAQITTFESGDVVQDGLNGLIVPCNDVVALTNAIRRLYNSPKRILQFGRAARHRAETELTWDHFRERLAQAYDLVLRRHASR